jgi:hypothetical protein
MKLTNGMLDNIRKDESKQDKSLKHTKLLLGMNKNNLSMKQTDKLSELLSTNLKVAE